MEERFASFFEVWPTGESSHGEAHGTRKISLVSVSLSSRMSVPTAILHGHNISKDS
jgi:hypothetical protein